MKPILIIGLPGSGKTTLAQFVAWNLNAVHWNADSVRANLNKDLDFSVESRIEQSRRMGYLARTVVDAGHECVVDLVCPLPECREAFGDAFLVWVDRIEAGRFEDTNKLFVPPTEYHVRIEPGMTVEDELNRVLDLYDLHCRL